MLSGEIRSHEVSPAFRELHKIRFRYINMHKYVPHTLQFLSGNRGCGVIVIVYMDCGKKSKKSRELVEIMPADDWKGLKKGAQKKRI